MKDKPSSSSRSTGQPGRSRSPQYGGGRPTPPRRQRGRQWLAVAVLALVLVVVAAAVILSQQNPAQTPTSAGALPGAENGHSLGSAQASVVVTDWSDFQ